MTHSPTTFSVKGDRLGSTRPEGGRTAGAAPLPQRLADVAVTLVIPALNAGDAIAETVRKARQVLSDRGTTSQTLCYLSTHHVVGFVPIEYHDRVGKSKVRHFVDSLRTAQTCPFPQGGAQPPAEPMDGG